MRRLFVLGNGLRPGVKAEAQKLLPFLQSLAQVVVFDLEQEADLRHVEADMALVLGGDGAILRAARQMGYKQVPTLGLNLGRLGFLAEVNLEEATTVLPQVINGPLRSTKHLMYECEINQASGQHTLLGLNEIIVYADPPMQLVEI